MWVVCCNSLCRFGTGNDGDLGVTGHTAGTMKSMQNNTQPTVAAIHQRRSARLLYRARARAAWLRGQIREQDEPGGYVEGWANDARVTSTARKVGINRGACGEGKFMPAIVCFRWFGLRIPANSCSPQPRSPTDPRGWSIGGESSGGVHDEKNA